MADNVPSLDLGSLIFRHLEFLLVNHRRRFLLLLDRRDGVLAFVASRVPVEEYDNSQGHAPCASDDEGGPPAMS